MRTVTFAALALLTLLGLSFVHAEDKAPEKFKLGRQKVGSYVVSAVMLGDPHDQKTVELDVKLFDEKEGKTPPPDPKAIRAWIGAEGDKDKVALTKKKTTFGATVPVPAPLAKAAKLWIEVETDAGLSQGSFSLDHGHDHKH